MKRGTRNTIGALAMCCLIIPVAGLDLPVWGESPFVSQVRRDTEWFAGYQTRVIGTEEHDRAVAELLSELKEVPGVRVWVREFPLVVPRVRRAELVISGQPSPERHRIYPLWPAGARLNTTPEGGINGPLVYVGQGKYANVPPHGLRGNIAVMEMTGGDGWMTAYNAGARAVLLLGSADEDSQDAATHVTPIPINVPRFYLPDGGLADKLREGENLEGSIFGEGDWVETTATNLYVLIAPAANTEPQQALAVGVPIDSMSIVPELAPGADRAVDLAFVLNILRETAQKPPPQPVFFAFVDAYSIAQRGVREMLATLGTVPDDWNRHTREEHDLREEYEKHERLAAELEAQSNFLEILHQKQYGPLHQYVKDEVAREVVTIETELHPLRVRLHGQSGNGDEELRTQVDDLSAKRTEFFAAQMQLLTRTPITSRKLASTLWQRARARIAGQLEDSQRRIRTIEGRYRFREEVLEVLGLDASVNCPLYFLLGVDLSDAGVAVGPSPFCRFLGHNETWNSDDFRSWLSVIDDATPESVWPGDLRQAVDLDCLSGLDAPESYQVGEVGNLSSPSQSFGLPAATWGTLEGLRVRGDTPQDRADRLDWSRLEPQIEATHSLIKTLISSDDFKPTFKGAKRWNRVRGTIVDLSPGEPVPRVPMKGYLTTLFSGGFSGYTGYPRLRSIVPGMRFQEFTFTGADGRFLFDVLPAHTDWGYGHVMLQSYLLESDGRITRAIDNGKAGKGVRLQTHVGSQTALPLRAMVFTCDEMTGLEYFDPRFLLPLPAATVLDARRNGLPQRINFMLHQGTVSCFLEPNTWWELILRAGATRNRMALLNMMTPEEAKGVPTRDAMLGFPIGKPLPLHPLYLAARDMSRLDEIRLRNYRQAGIKSEAIDRLRRRSDKLLTDAEAALKRDDGAEFYQAAGGALANEVRAYQAVRDLANDVVRAAIFLLLALVPFSFALERLLFASPNIYRQLIGIIGIFTVMTAILWSFHPAFRISNQPLMIVMAFAIIFMSLLVMSVVYSKFESGLEEVRSGRSESSGARTARGGVLSSAVRLGIANMRKRKLRTVLTGTTVILITFVLLCFTSTSSYMGHRELKLAATAPSTGVLVRQPSLRPIPLQALPYLENVVGATGEVVPRYWWVNPWRAQWRIHVRNAKTGRQIAVPAGLGLAAGEAAITRVDRFLPDWDRFAAGNGCYLAEETARSLGVDRGDTVLVGGRELELIAAFDSAAFDQQIRGMDGETILPNDYSSINEDQRRLLEGTWDPAVLAAEMESGAGLSTGREHPRLPSASVIILPADMLHGLRDCTLRSMAIRTDSAEQAQQLAMELARRLAFPIYYGTPKGVRAVAATVLIPTGPTSLLFPLLIGGLIIFNTLLGSIAERKGEIHIYTSIGLAPLHIGVLFLAEAITYGLMGSIAGYVIGQGVATLFNQLGWMAGVTLNYSGTQAIATMLMVLVIVVLSSLVPAYLAGKLAVPSANMRWKVPEPEGDLIRDTLPFTVTGQTANGVLLFLYEYLDAHREGSIGNFSTDDLRTFEEETDGLVLLGIEGTVWLAPYDLGVRQDIRLTIRPTDLEDVYEIDIELRRGSGQVRTWWKLNRVFMAELRKQLLGWRNLKLDRMLQYIADSAGVLSSAEATQK